MRFMAFESLATLLFVQHLVQANNEETRILSTTGPSSGNPLVYSPHKEPVMRKVFVSHDVIMYIAQEVIYSTSWLRHKMETFSASLTLCAGNSPVTGAFPSQRPVTRSFDPSFDLRLNKRLSKQSWGWWFDMPSRSSWRHCNASELSQHALSPLKQFTRDKLIVV